MVFKNTVYLISYFHGTSGQFIRAIVQLFLSNKQKIIDFPEDGTAENLVLPFYQGCFFRYEFISNYEILKHNFFSTINPSNEMPYLYAEHPVPNWNDFFKKFPNGKNLIIQLNEKMLYRQAANSYYKQKFRNISNVSLIDQVTAKGEVDRIYRVFSKTQIKNNVIQYPYRDTDIIPKSYKNIFTIHLYDLIHNKNKILETLSKFCERPITENIITSYNNYLEKQKQLFPWLDDK